MAFQRFLPRRDYRCIFLYLTRGEAVCKMLRMVKKGVQMSVSAALVGCCVMLSSCVGVNLSDKLLDRCQYRQAVIIPGWDSGKAELYRADGKLYVKGVHTTFRRSNRSGAYIFVENPYEQYTIVPGSEQQLVYAEVAKLPEVKLSKAYDIWQEKLPSGAVPVKKPALGQLPAFGYMQMGSLDPAVKDGHDPITALDITQIRKSSIFYIPAAGLTNLLVDFPGTVLGTVASPVIVGLHPGYSFSEPVDCSPYVPEIYRQSAQKR